MPDTTSLRQLRYTSPFPAGRADTTTFWRLRHTSPFPAGTADTFWRLQQTSPLAGGEGRHEAGDGLLATGHLSLPRQILSHLGLQRLPRTIGFTKKRKEKDRGRVHVEKKGKGAQAALRT